LADVEIRGESRLRQAVIVIAAKQLVNGIFVFMAGQWQSMISTSAAVFSSQRKITRHGLLMRMECMPH